MTAPNATDVIAIVVAPRATNVPAADPNAVTKVRAIAHGQVKDLDNTIVIRSGRVGARVCWVWAFVL